MHDASARPLREGTTPRVFAHRGDAPAPANTLPAVAHLVAAGCDGLAVDVALTRDGVLVGGDDALVRAAGLSGSAIAQLSWAELARVDFAAVLGTHDAPAPLLAVQDLLWFLTPRVSVALRFGRVDPNVVASLARCEARWSRTLLIAPSVDEARALRVAAPGAVRVAVADPSVLPADVDGVAADVRAFEGTEKHRGLRIGLGCETTARAEIAVALGLDVAFTERPAWLAETFGRIAGRAPRA